MKQGNYYVVEVKHSKDNLLHRTIVRCVNEDKGILQFINYDEYLTESMDEIYHLKIIDEIKSMNRK